MDPKKRRERFILREYKKYKNNREFSEKTGINIATIRQTLHQHKIFRQIIEPWPKEAVAFMKKNYKRMGDLEISYWLNMKFPKLKKWTNKHVEKKRTQLGIKRSQSQILAIKKRNVANGAYQHMTTWETRGIMQPGTLRVWYQGEHPRVVIKTEKGFVSYSRYLWEKHKGKIPPNMKIGFIDGNPFNVVIENLVLRTNAEHAKYSHAPANIQKLKDNLKILNHLIFKHEQNAKH